MLHNLRHACWKQSMSNMHVAKQSMSTSFGHACCIIEYMHVADPKHVDIIPPLLKTCMLQTKHTCQHETKGKSVVYRYSFSNPRTQVHCQQRLPACSLTHRYQFYSAVGTLIHLFLGESPHHLHTLVRVAPPHIPHM